MNQQLCLATEQKSFFFPLITSVLLLFIIINLSMNLDNESLLLFLFLFSNNQYILPVESEH